MGEGIILTIPSQEKPKPYVIAYLDLLGTTSKISNDENECYLYRIRQIYNMAVQCSGNEKFSELGFDEIKTKIFSDNIIIAMPLDSEHNIDRTYCLLKFIAIIQNYAAISSHWLVRGGITIGDLVLDKLLVWGTGLVRAYELENHIAIYPRIVIDRNILDLFPSNNPFFRKDIDGQFYLNFLNFMKYRDTEGNDNFVSTIQNSFAQMLSEIKKPNGDYAEKPYQKLQWYKNYINSWYSETHPDTDTLPIQESSFT